MRNNIASYPHIFMKLNQSLLLNTILSPSSSPDNNSNENFFNKILMQLNEWLGFFPNLINSLIVKFKDTFPNFFETLGHWLALAAPYLIPGAAIVAVCAVLFFCLPVIVGCFAWLAAACWAVISAVFMLLWRIFSGFFTLLWRIFRGFFTLLWQMCSGLFTLVSWMCQSLFGMCCLCGQNSLKMMIAPGTAGAVLIPRAVFESNPAAYFSNLRAGLV